MREGPLLAVGTEVVPLVEGRAIGGVASAGSEGFVALAAQNAISPIRDRAAHVGEQSEFGELCGAAAAVGGDIQTVVAVGTGAGDGVGVHLEAVCEALVAPVVERGPCRAVVGALEVPVSRVA